MHHTRLQDLIGRLFGGVMYQGMPKAWPGYTAGLLAISEEQAFRYLDGTDEIPREIEQRLTEFFTRPVTELGMTLQHAFGYLSNMAGFWRTAQNVPVNEWMEKGTFHLIDGSPNDFHQEDSNSTANSSAGYNCFFLDIDDSYVALQMVLMARAMGLRAALFTFEVEDPELCVYVNATGLVIPESPKPGE
jgi:hypothetical protein